MKMYLSSIVAVAGLASVSMGQDFALNLVAGSDFNAGTTNIIEVYGSSSVGTHVLGGGFDLTVESSASINVLSMTWQPAEWSSFNEDNTGYDGTGYYGDIVFGQLLLPIPGFDVPGQGSEYNGLGDGALLGSYEVVLDHEATLFDFLHFSLSTGSPFGLEVIDINTFETFQDVDGNLDLGGLTIGVPSPSAMALLGFGGLAASRRRRA